MLVPHITEVGVLHAALVSLEEEEGEAGDLMIHEKTRPDRTTSPWVEMVLFDKKQVLTSKHELMRKSRNGVGVKTKINLKLQGKANDKTLYLKKEHVKRLKLYLFIFMSGVNESGGASDGGTSGGKEGDGGGVLNEGIRLTKNFRNRMQESMVSDTVMSDAGPDGSVSYRSKLLNMERSVHGSKAVEEVKITTEDYRIDCSGEVPSIDLSKEVHDVLAKGMERTLIIKLLGCSITYPTLLARTQALWRPRGCFRLVDMEGGFYMVTFDLEEDYTKVLTGGPWMLFGAYLAVQPWTMDFDPSSSVMSKVVVWVRILGLSFRYYHKAALQAIGTLLGEVIRVDHMTENRGRGRYARISVLMDLLKPLVPWIKVDGKLHGIEYEGLPQICFTCRRYGHTIGKCKGEDVLNYEAFREKIPTLQENPGDQCTMSSPTQVVGGEPKVASPSYGEWMQLRPTWKLTKPTQEYRKKVSGVSPSSNGELPKASCAASKDLDAGRSQFSNAPGHGVAEESVPSQDGPRIEIANDLALVESKLIMVEAKSSFDSDRNTVMELQRVRQALDEVNPLALNGSNGKDEVMMGSGEAWTGK
ncbi:hypothetical protein K1719_000454 [Acacia pycnantha]|nr:hypothetical protein K1719_000454 [Acacia pycnantha]